MPKYDLHTLLAFVFGNNTASLSLLEKSGFTAWGNLPKIADMQSHFEDLVILGYQQAV
jgi:phosphinothricin acetyltransferase